MLWGDCRRSRYCRDLVVDLQGTHCRPMRGVGGVIIKGF